MLFSFETTPLTVEANCRTHKFHIKPILCGL